MVAVPSDTAVFHFASCRRCGQEALTSKKDGYDYEQLITPKALSNAAIGFDRSATSREKHGNDLAVLPHQDVR
jgi:hypothetical protein